EMDRMSSGTHDGVMLRELHRALGNDAYLIAETLARPALVDRLVRSWYASDSRFHAETRALADAAIAACASVDCMRAMGGEYRETTWKLRREGPDAALQPGVTILDEDEW